MSKVALLDGDILCYRIGFGYEKEESEALVKWQVDRTCNAICTSVDAASYEVFLTANDKSNFRLKVYPEYKANRKAPKPKWYTVIRNHLLTKWDATEVSGIEADDAIAIKATALGDECVICSLDKDFNQLAGWKYNFAGKTLFYTSKEDANKNFWIQVLMGDRVDNIPGIPGLGPCRASGILSQTNQDQYCDKVREIYRQKYGETDYERILLQRCQLLWLKRTQDDVFVLPEENGHDLKTNSEKSLENLESTSNTKL